MESSWNPFGIFSYASPVTGAPNGPPEEDSFPTADPDSILDSIRRARAAAAATNAECDPAPHGPPSPARSARSAGTHPEGIEVDIDAGPIAYAGGGVRAFLAAREEAEHGYWKKRRWAAGRLFGGGIGSSSSPKHSAKTGRTHILDPHSGRTHILDDDGFLVPPPPPDDGAGETNASKKRRRIVAAALLIMLVGVAVVLGVVLGGNNSSGSRSSAVAGGSDVPDDFGNAGGGGGGPDEFDNGSGNQNSNPADAFPAAAPAARPRPSRPVGPPAPCGSGTYDAGFGCRGRCEAGQKCGPYGLFDAFYPNDRRDCPAMCCRNGRVERGPQDAWYQCCEGVAGNLADYRRAGSNVRRSCSPLF